MKHSARQASSEDLMATATTITSTVQRVSSTCGGRLQTAQHRVHDAETTLHAARQSGIDAWVAAAYDRLHEAIIEYTALDRRAA
jgi:hypothetical protein